MNKLSLQRLFRGNNSSSSNHSRHNNNNLPNFAIPNVRVPVITTNSNIRMPQRSNLNRPSQSYLVGRNFSSLPRNNRTEAYPSIIRQQNNNNNRISNNINNNSNRNINYNYNNVDNSLMPLNENRIDPSGLINEICIANINNNCKFGKRCRFVHGKPCSLCHQNVYNPLKELSSQVRIHSVDCKSKITKEREEKDTKENEKEYVCSICLEKIVPPTKFGVLCNCSHYFCYPCIKIWRNSQDFSDINNHLKCPLCKTKSQFLIPSATFPKTERERYLLITQYKQELANTECRRLRVTNFKFCPYGDNCIYSHYRPDGTYMHFTFLTDAYQFISPEEYNQNIIQHDITGSIQYYNDCLIEEALIDDDGDGFGMHNGIFRNPFYNGNDELYEDEDDVDMDNLIQINGFISPPPVPNEYDPSLGYMMNNINNDLERMNFDENDENDDGDVSDIHDSEISDYLNEIDEDLNLYYMMNNRNNRNNNNSNTGYIMNNYNSYGENRLSQHPHYFYNRNLPYPSLPPPYRQRNINNNNSNSNSNSNSNTNTNINTNTNNNINTNINTNTNTNTNNNININSNININTNFNTNTYFNDVSSNTSLSTFRREHNRSLSTNNTNSYLNSDTINRQYRENLSLPRSYSGQTSFSKYYSNLNRSNLPFLESFDTIPEENRNFMPSSSYSTTQSASYNDKFNTITSSSGHSSKEYSENLNSNNKLKANSMITTSVSSVTLTAIDTLTDNRDSNSKRSDSLSRKSKKENEEKNKISKNKKKEKEEDQIRKSKEKEKEKIEKQHRKNREKEKEEHKNKEKEKQKIQNIKNREKEKKEDSITFNNHIIKSLKEKDESKNDLYRITFNQHIPKLNEKNGNEDDDEVEEDENRLKFYRSNSASSMGVNIPIQQDYPSIPQINVNNLTISQQDQLPQRHQKKRHHLNKQYHNKGLLGKIGDRNEINSQVGSTVSSTSQFRPIYTSRNADIEIESATSLTSSSSFIGEEEIYAKYYRGNEHCFSSSGSGIATTVSSNPIGIPIPTNYASSSVQNISSSHRINNMSVTSHHYSSGDDHHYSSSCESNVSGTSSRDINVEFDHSHPKQSSNNYSPIFF